MNRMVSSLVLVSIFGWISYITIDEFWLIKSQPQATTPKPKSVIDYDNFTDELCEIHGEWLSLTNQVYFKKSASYYLADLNIIYLNFIRHLHAKLDKLEFNLSIWAEWGEKKHYFNRKLKNYSLFHIESWATSYQSMSISIQFDFHKEIYGLLNVTPNFNNFKPFKMSLQVFDENLNQSLRMPLDILIKYSPHHTNPNSSGIAVCTKILFIEENKQFENFKIWIYINQLLGYDKIIVYNRPGYVLDKKRAEFFHLHLDLIQVKQQFCMPNLVNSTKANRYFGYIQSKEINQRIYDSFDTTSYVYLSECFLDNFDKFRYIEARDTDEFIMANIAHQISARNFLVDNILANNKSIQYLFSRTNKIFNGPSRASVLLSYSNFIKNENFDRFCVKFKQTLSTRNQSIDFDEDIFNAKDKRLKIRIDFRNESQTKYASYLCGLNDNMVKPLLSSRTDLADSNFARFFSTFYFHGKSIHDTWKILTISTHSAFVGYRLDINNETILNKLSSEYCFECGYTAHFRDSQGFHLGPSDHFNIEHIYFDYLFFQAVSNFDGF